MNESGFNTTDIFWKNSDYSKQEYEGCQLTDAMIVSTEQELGFKLPIAYLTLLKNQNGGIPRNNCCATSEATSWADDHVALMGMFGTDGAKKYSLNGTCGSQYFIDEWNYPPIGVYFCDSPLFGNDMFCLDYSICGPCGEPRIVHVDQKRGLKISVLAENFLQFLVMLKSEDCFP